MRYDAVDFTLFTESELQIILFASDCRWYNECTERDKYEIVVQALNKNHQLI